MPLQLVLPGRRPSVRRYSCNIPPAKPCSTGRPTSLAARPALGAPLLGARPPCSWLKPGCPGAREEAPAAAAVSASVWPPPGSNIEAAVRLASARQATPSSPSADARQLRQYMEQELHDFICSCLERLGAERPKDPAAFMLRCFHEGSRQPLSPPLDSEFTTQEVYAYLRRSSIFQLLKAAMRACAECRPPSPHQVTMLCGPRLLSWLHSAVLGDV